MFRKILFQAHWFVGITIGTMLAFSGLTGGLMAFGPELTNFFSGAYEKVEVLPSGQLSATELYAKIKAARPDQSITKLTIYEEPGRVARVTYAAPPGPMGPMSARAEIQNVNPYTGELLPVQAAGDKVYVFMQWLRDVHQGHWSGPGTITDIVATVIGLATVLLLVMALSGLYLRWPRGKAVRDWKSWLKIHTKLKGQAFLWNLHAVFGTCAFLIYLVIAHSGAYQNGEMLWYGNAARTVYGVPTRAPRGEGMGAGPQGGMAAGMPMPGGEAGPMMGPPGGEGPGAGPEGLPGGARGVSVVYMGKDSYVDSDNDDINARSATLDPATGVLTPRQERAAATTVGQTLDRNNQLIHEGRIFGPVGSLLFMLAGLSMPVFYVTGWMMYLNRRRRKQKAQRPVAA